MADEDDEPRLCHDGGQLFLLVGSTKKDPGRPDGTGGSAGTAATSRLYLMAKAEEESQVGE